MWMADRPALTRLVIPGKLFPVGACVMDEDSRTYRERAMHARLGAKEARTAEHRLIFERLAQSYDQLARDSEWLEGTPYSLPGQNDRTGAR